MISADQWLKISHEEAQETILHQIILQKIRVNSWFKLHGCGYAALSFFLSSLFRVVDIKKAA